MGRRANKEPANFTFSDAGSTSDTGDNSGGTDGDNSAAGIVDPASLATGSGDGSGSRDSNDTGNSPRRGRGRPKGSGKKKAPADIDFVADLLSSGHAFVAFSTGVEEFLLDDDEAQKLQSETTELASHYAEAVSPK